MNYTLEQGTSFVIPTIAPPPVAHVVYVEYGGTFYCLFVNCGQIIRLAQNESGTWMDGYCHGLGRGFTMPVRVEVLDYTEGEDVTVAYARKFVATAPVIRPIGGGGR